MSSQKISTRSLGRAMLERDLDGVHLALGEQDGVLGNAVVERAAFISFGTSSGARPRGLSSAWQM